MRQERVRPRPRKAAAAEVVEDLTVEEAEADLVSAIDALLDEIDAVLEDQSVLVGYRQRSGQ